MVREYFNRAIAKLNDEFKSRVKTALRNRSYKNQTHVRVAFRKERWV
ncbi:hypothetical protein [Nostoc sp.]